MSAEAQIKSFIERIIRLKDEQDAIGEDIKAVYAEAKSLGFDKTGLGDVVTHLRKIEKKGADTIAEKEAIFDIYLSAYQGPQARASARARENIEEFGAETGEIIDRDARRRDRMSESMDDTKALSAEAVALGLISEKDHAETVAIADAVARKFGNGPLNTRSDAPPASAAAVISSSNDTATGEAGSPVGLPENPVANVGEEFADESAASSVDPASRTDDVRERQHASTVGFADDCRTGGKEQVAAAPVPVGEADARSLPANFEPDGGAISEVKGKARLENADGVEPPPSVPAFIAKTYLLRPDCQQRSNCRSGTTDHCHSCKVAMRERERADA
jgi:uncharacterized protein (UPF0335 family)